MSRLIWWAVACGILFAIAGWVCGQFLEAQDYLTQFDKKPKERLIEAGYRFVAHPLRGGFVGVIVGFLAGTLTKLGKK